MAEQPDFDNQTTVAGGTLYLVAVPIGNPRDITLRALDILRAVDLIAAEDTREFRPLARVHGIATKTISYHDYNEATRARELLDRLLLGESIALVSDAGTPLINDPGFRIVQTAAAAGVPVTSVPGPNALVTALAASGIAPVPFLFLGYPPRTGSKRRALFTRYGHEPATLTFYEAPHRLVTTLSDALTVLGDRQACLGRNLTKTHERYQRGPISQILAELATETTVRGEATIVIAGASEVAPTEEDGEAVSDEIAALLADGLDSRAILEQVMARHGLKRREAYDLILHAKRNADG
jgi:16S rRNA (cytidine1402-2'-O)-methyltransferase